MNKRILLMSIVFLGLIGCGGFLYKALPLDSNNETVVLSEGMDVSVSVTSPEDILSKKLRNEFKRQLTIKNINVVDESSNTMVVEIDKYEKGVGIFRFMSIPFLTASLGASYLDGTVELTTDKGNTTLNVLKTGQMTGVTQTKDQTDDNADMFVKKVVYKMFDKSK